MVYIRRKKSNRPLRRRRVARKFVRPARSLALNPAPIFTETYLMPSGTAAPYSMDANAGGVLAVTMDHIPQLAQYSALYQKYRILGARFICIPTHNSAAADVNSEIPPVAGAFQAAGLSRIVYAINNSPNQVVLPVNETEVLTDNGCRIVCGSPKLIMSCRPVPQTEDSVGNRFSLRGKYLNFENAGNTPHYGITWWHSQPVLPGNAGFGVPYFVYVKLTFQLSDPR
jgi:hypothetical protein